MKGPDGNDERIKAGEERGQEKAQPSEGLVGVVREKEERKVRARREGKRGLAYGLGMFGVVGWSVSVPTLLGIFLGVWIDSRTDGQYSWTLMLMMAGLILGLFNAWYWVQKESQRD